ncbi:MAG: DUF4296 domain-containing protein [Aquaticitalea sp.]
MKKWIVIVLGILLINCHDSNKPKKPENLISKDKMSDILYDVYLLNAAKGINKRVLENNGILPQEYVYKKYNIDSLQFELSNDYYSYDTKIYEEIIEKVKQKLEAEKMINDALSLKEDKTKDSIYKVKLKEKKSDTSLKKLKVQDKNFKRKY